MRNWAIIVCVMSVITACHDAEPPQLSGEPPTTVTDTPQSDDEWLADASVRYESPEKVLRYDDGGVMVIRRPDGNVEFIEIETGLKVAVGLQQPYSLTIDGRDISLSNVEVVSESDLCRWLTLTSDCGKDYRVVLPR